MKKILIDSELLRTLYWENKWSVHRIGKFLSVNYMTVQRRMKEFKIPRRDLSAAIQLNWKNPKTLDKARASHLGKKLGDIGKAKLRESKRKYWTTEKRIALSKKQTGRRLTLEWKKKISAARLNIPLTEWHEFSSTTNHRRRKTLEYFEWRLKIFQRDSFTCQKCGDQKRKRLQAHHIQLIKDRSDLVYDLNNGITLCKTCHQ